MSAAKIAICQLFDRESCTYTYLVYDAQTREGAIIDPVIGLFERDMNIVQELGIELLYTLETHAHADHITGSGKIRQNTGAKIVYGEKTGVAAIDILIEDGQSLPLGHHQIAAISTPGHTGGCTSYLVDGYLFCGDTLLIRGCGRTDFQDGNPETLYDSIYSRLFVLSDDTVVYPAHDYNGRTSSTIGEEKKWNPRLGNNRSKQSFVNLMNNLNLDMPKHIHEAVPANINVGVNFDPNRYLMSDYTMHDLHEVWLNPPANSLILDNRTVEEYGKAHVPGSRNIPMGTEADFIDELSAYDHIYIYCRSGRRAQTTTTNLSFKGLDQITCVSHSGMPDWEKAGYPVERDD